MLSTPVLSPGGLSAWDALMYTVVDQQILLYCPHWGRELPRTQQGVGSTVWWYSFLWLGNAPLGSGTSWPASETGVWNLGAVIGC